MPSSNTTLDLASPDLLRIIDSLFACNVGHHIHLPQLVVVGNQSSGKSSVLEGISRLPFPKDSGLCTQFATQITFRRNEVKHTKVQILPANDASPDHKEDCQKWEATWANRDPKSFVEIMTEVRPGPYAFTDHSHSSAGKESHGIRMDVSSDASLSDRTQQTFSEDVLKIEVLGPEEAHFSIIDVPGIFKVATEGRTTREDIAMVDRMVEGYVKNPRSIILAVVPANVDLATEDILNIAHKHDPKGARTIGVLTKPDLIDKGGERSVLDVLQGKRHKLHHGWCVVRNLGQKESETYADRDKLEGDFFSKELPWTRVEKTRAGIVSLRTKLSKLMRAHTEKEFPAVKAELEDTLQTSKNELDSLGPVRGSVSEQASYLIVIATAFQDMTKKAKTATYNGDRFFDDKKMRLITRIANRGDKFTWLLQKYGHTHEFDKVPGEFDAGSLGMSEAEEAPMELSRTLPDVPALKAVLDPCAKLHPPSQGEIMEWLEEVYDDARGLELMSDAKLSTTMSEQSKKWDNICHGYISDVIVMLHHFLLKLLSHVCPDEQVRRALLALLEDRIMEGYLKARQNVEFNLNVELKKTPTTQNEKFNDLLQEYRAHRLVERLRTRSFIPHTINTQAKAVWMSDIKSSLKGMSNREYMVEQMHDTLKAYYEIARPRAVDTMTKHGMESFLLSGDGTPLDVLSPQWVSSLDADTLERIAGEDSDTKTKREELKKAIADLEKGKRILQNA